MKRFVNCNFYLQDTPPEYQNEFQSFSQHELQENIGHGHITFLPINSVEQPIIVEKLPKPIRAFS